MSTTTAATTRSAPSDPVEFLTSHPHHLLVGTYTGFARPLGDALQLQANASSSDPDRLGGLLPTGFARNIGYASQADIFDIQVTKIENGDGTDSAVAVASTVVESEAVLSSVQTADLLTVRGQITSCRTGEGMMTAPFTGLLDTTTGELRLSFPEVKAATLTARPVLRSLIQSLTQCQLQVDWTRSSINRGTIVITGDGTEEWYECKREVRVTSTSIGYELLMTHSVSTLALICRFLKPLDLISVYKSNRRLSEAACNPLAHQSGNQVAVEHTFEVCRSYLINGGMTCSFSNSDIMKAAFSSRLFHHIRSIHIDPGLFSKKKGDDSLITWLSIFLLPSAPSLRSLILEFPLLELEPALPADIMNIMPPRSDWDVSMPRNRAARQQEETTKLESTLRQESELESTLTQVNLMTAPCLQYLRLLHLTLTFPVAEVFCSHIPLSVELLHFTFVPRSRHVAAASTQTIPTSLLTYLKKHKKADQGTSAKLTGDDVAHSSAFSSSSSSLRRLIVDVHHLNQTRRSTRVQDLILLRDLHALGVLEEIHWDVPININQLAKRLIDCGVLDLTNFKLSLITSLRVGDISYNGQGAPISFDLLSCFPQLQSLLITGKFELTERLLGHFKEWPQTLRHSLKSLSVILPNQWTQDNTAVSSLATAGLSQVTQLVLSAQTSNAASHKASMRALFTSMPQLTDLTLVKITMNAEDITSFRHLPHLVSLKEFIWSRSSQPLFREENASPTLDDGEKAINAPSFRDIFPSLSTLQIAGYHGEMPYYLLRHLSPQLTHFKWMREDWIHSSELIELRWNEEEKRQKREKDRKASYEARVIVKQEVEPITVENPSSSEMWFPNSLLAPVSITPVSFGNPSFDGTSSLFPSASTSIPDTFSSTFEFGGTAFNPFTSTDPSASTTSVSPFSASLSSNPFPYFAASSSSPISSFLSGSPFTLETASSTNSSTSASTIPTTSSSSVASLIDNDDELQRAFHAFAASFHTPDVEAPTAAAGASSAANPFSAFLASDFTSTSSSASSSTTQSTGMNLLQPFEFSVPSLSSSFFSSPSSSSSFITSTFAPSHATYFPPSSELSAAAASSESPTSWFPSSAFPSAAPPLEEIEPDSPRVIFAASPSSISSSLVPSVSVGSFTIPKTTTGKRGRKD